MAVGSNFLISIVDLAVTPNPYQASDVSWGSKKSKKEKREILTNGASDMEKITTP